jgi:hypothetical protein
MIDLSRTNTRLECSHRECPPHEPKCLVLVLELCSFGSRFEDEGRYENDRRCGRLLANFEVQGLNARSLLLGKTFRANDDWIRDRGVAPAYYGRDLRSDDPGPLARKSEEPRISKEGRLAPFVLRVFALHLLFDFRILFSPETN